MRSMITTVNPFDDFGVNMVEDLNRIYRENRVVPN